MIANYIAAKLFVDKPKIPYDIYKKFKPIVDEISEWGNTLEGLSIEEPGSWFKTGNKIMSKMVERPPYSVSPEMIYLRDRCGDWNIINNHLEWLAIHIYRRENFHIEKEFPLSRIGRIELGEGLEAYIQIDKDGEEQDPQNYIPTIMVPTEKRKECLKAMGDMFWKTRNCIFLDEDSEDFVMSNHEFQNSEYYGDTADLVELWEKYIAKNVRRVIILQGIPGTGKSTLCAYAAEKLSNKTMVIGHEFFKRVSQSEWRDIQLTLRPKVVIVDDIDRIPAPILENSLSMFEEAFYKVPLTLFTTNDQRKLPGAFKRPGRVDQIINMPEPPYDVKKDMIREFAKDIGMDHSLMKEEQLEYLISMYEKIPSGAYVKELLRRYMVEGTDYRLPDYDDTFKTLDEVGYDSPAHTF